MWEFFFLLMLLIIAGYLSGIRSALDEVIEVLHKIADTIPRSNGPTI